jgi:hypothetical protein
MQKDITYLPPIAEWQSEHRRQPFLSHVRILLDTIFKTTFKALTNTPINSDNSNSQKREQKGDMIGMELQC